MRHGLPPTPEHGRVCAKDEPVSWHILLLLGRDRVILGLPVKSCGRPPLHSAISLASDSPLATSRPPVLLLADTGFECGTSTFWVLNPDVGRSLLVVWLQGWILHPNRGPNKKNLLVPGPGDRKRQRLCVLVLVPWPYVRNVLLDRSGLSLDHPSRHTISLG